MVAGFAGPMVGATSAGHCIRVRESVEFSDKASCDALARHTLAAGRQPKDLGLREVIGVAPTSEVGRALRVNRNSVAHIQFSAAKVTGELKVGASRVQHGQESIHAATALCILTAYGL